MEGRDFAPPPHLLSERGALVHRAASRIASTGHSSVQHPGHFQPGKYYPSHIPMAPHSGSGLMGNSSPSFTFLASSLGSPPSHPAHPSRPPSSPSSPSFHSRPHSSASQIWFPHSHEAAPGYPRFSGSLAPTFLPMSHLDHHGNSSVLYGQHRFYDTQKENFYLRSLPSQPPLLSSNHSLPPLPRTATGHPLGSCSRERDSGGGVLNKGPKEGEVERGPVQGHKEKERAGGKQDAKERQHHGLHPPPHAQHHHPHYPQHAAPLEEDGSRGMGYKEHPLARAKPLSACLLNGKVAGGEAGAGAKGSLSSCGGAGGGAGSSAAARHMGAGANGRCGKEGVSGEMRISEHPSDCLERGQVLHHSVPYSVPPPLPVGPASGGGNPGGFHCLQLHPSHAHHAPQPHPHHPHHPHHHHHHHHHHPPDFYCPPPHPHPPAPLANPSPHEKGPPAGGRDPKVTGPTFVPSVGHLGEKAGGPFQLGHPDCRGAGGGGAAKDRGMEKSGSGGGVPLPHPSGSWQRKQQQQQQQQQQHAYGKADKAPDWLQPHHQHLQQQPQHHQHPGPRSRSADCISNAADVDVYRPSLPQGAKGGHSGGAVGALAYQDCSLSGPPPGTPPRDAKAAPQQGGVGGGRGVCAMQRDGGQKVARIRHQQHNRAGPDGAELAQAGGGQDHAKRKMDAPSLGYGGRGHQQPHGQQQQQQQQQQLASLPPWAVRAHHIHPEEEQRKACLESFGGGVAGGGVRPQGQQQQQQQQQQPGMGLSPSPQDLHGPQGEGNAMKSLLKYSSQQQPLLLSQKSPFGGLGTLRNGSGNGSGSSCVLQGGKQALPPRKGPPSEGDRPDCGGRAREVGEVHPGEGEVRQPPVGIAVAVARQREPPCRPLDGHTSQSRQGRVLPGMKGVSRSVFPLDPDGDEERKRLCGEQLGLSCLDRERELLIRDNKERVEFARIHPSSSCHGDLTSHLMVPSGASLQSSQLGADPAAHAHPAHHHWMPRTGSPSLWMTGHSYGIGHTALHQNLPPGFSTAMASPLQPVLPLPQDPSAQLVVLPAEPPAHLDVMEQPGLWPPVYGARGPPSHMQHPAVYSRSPFLRQQELYALQQHQHQQQQHHHQHHHHHHHHQQQPQQQHRETQAIELQHRHSHSQVQKKPEEPPMELEDLLQEPRTPKPAKPFSFTPSNKNTPSPGACSAHLSPCCRSPSLRPHPKSTPCTPCPAPSPAAAAPHSPALSPAPPHASKGVESQDKRGEGQPPQDYPQSLEPDLPPGYTYPAIAMGYRSGPSPQDVRLAEPADLEAVQVEPAEPAPQPIPDLTDDCEQEVGLRALPEQQDEDEEEEARGVESGGGGVVEVGGLTSYCAQSELEQEQEELFACPATEGGVLQDTPCPTPPSVVVTQGDDLSVTHGNGVEEEAVDQVEAAIEKPEDGGVLGPDAPVDDAHSPGAATDEEQGRGLPPREGQTPPAPSPCPALPPPFSCWSLELLIAATLCADRDTPPPAPAASSLPCGAPFWPSHHGMELLSELAELERQQHCSGASQGEELLTFDLQSLATLAAARALEMEPQEGVAEGTGRHCPVRRTLNLRRKCTWTPRHEPVFPVKGAMETMDGPELAMRVRLAELQRRYKEKQRELAKLQRKHEHQKEETPRSPARRGPGRPRKRKSTPGPLPGAVPPADSPRRVKSLGGLGLLPDDLRGGGETPRKKRRLSNGSFDQLSAAQMKGRCCKQNGRQGVLGSKLAQFKQRPKTAVGPGFRRRGNPGSSVGPARLCQRGPKSEHRLSVESGGQSDTEEDEDECSYDSEDGPGDIKAMPSKDTSTSLAMTGPSPSSIVKLEANQKARNKKERQGLHGSHGVAGAEGEVKVKAKKSALRRPAPLAAARREPPGARRKRGPKPKALQPLWGRPGPGGGPYRRAAALGSLPTASERLKRATRKSTALRGLPGAVSARRSCWIGRAQSPSSEENSRDRRGRSKQPKGRAVSRLLESFAADEGFRMDEDGSFSEGEGDSCHSKRPSNPQRSPPAAPDCVLTKERLADGLKVLISKEDELLYAATVRTLELPDIYSVVIDGERGNRPRIYSLEQLLQEAVLDVRPETELMVPAGTRVCAYWSERSRCLYPGYVRRGGAGEEGKEGSVMVEFDDGDRGRISLPNIRLLPPDYQIHCAEPSPALLVSGRRGRRSSAQERSTPSDASSEKPDAEAIQTVEKTAIHKARRGRPKGSGKKNPMSDMVKKCSAPLFSWPAMAAPRKRTSHDLFQLNGGPRRPLKGRDLEAFPLAPAPIAAPAKAIFSSSFEVDSFSSIANGYSSFGRQPAALPPLTSNSAPCSRGRRPGEGDAPRCRKTGGAEFLVKLDHEGVTAPKTKNSKALQLLGATGPGGRVEKGFGGRGVSRPVGYSHPVLLVKDSKTGDGTRVELLLKGSSPLQKPAPGPAPGPALSLGEYADFGISCHSDCHSSYSDMDEDEEEEEEEERRALAAAAASGGLRTAGRFLSRLSVSSSSSASSSTSSSGSLSSSSLCSSENDSSYSSEDEEGSTLLLQGCLSSHHALLQPPEPPPPQRAFVAKAVAVTRGGAIGHGVGGGKPLKRKPCPAAPVKNAGEADGSGDGPKRHRLPPPVGHPIPKISSFLPPHQLWRWSGNPTQRRGMKGKARKLFYKAIVRGRDTVRVGDCAIFLSSGRPHLPYVGRIESFWESWANMVVKVKWFYHPEETKMGKRHRDGKHALYQSSHEDENDVQTISHRCQVVSREEYERLSRDRKLSGAGPGQDLYYLAGTYDPSSGQLVSADGVSILC